MMPTENQAPHAQDRLTPEDIEAVRLRFQDENGRMPDLRDHGAVTLSDISEAFGIPPADVQRELERVRAERALSTPSSHSFDQRGLLALAVILLTVAFAIYRFNPKPLTEDEKAKLLEDYVEQQRERRKKNPVIHYPIRTAVKSGAMPPAGFDVNFSGRLTETTAAPTDRQILSKDQAIAALSAALANAYAIARDAELAAPQPKKPLPKGPFENSGYQIIPDTIQYFIGRQRGYPMGSIRLHPDRPLPLNPQNGQPYYSSTPLIPSPETFRQIATTIVTDQWQTQNKSTERPKTRSKIPALPAGFTMTLVGRTQTGAMSVPLTVLPMDTTNLAARLEEAVRALMVQDQFYDDDQTMIGSTTVPSKKPIPAEFKLTIGGPSGPIELSLPQKAGGRYPTAADAARASEAAIKRGIAAAIRQIEDLNRKLGVAP